MKRQFSNFQDWEDHKAGLYEKKAQAFSKCEKSYNLLKNEKEFYKVMLKMTKKWPISTKFNLTNSSKNRRSWLGQAACCFNHGANELTTIVAWGFLKDDEKKKANIMAEKIIEKFEKEYAKKIS